MDKKELRSPLVLAKEIIAKLDEAQLTSEEAQELAGGARVTVSCFFQTCNTANEIE